MNGDVVDIKGQQSVSFALDGCEYQHTFLVCAVPTKAAVLIVKDLLESVGAMLDFDCCKMEWYKQQSAPRVYHVPSKGPRVLTIFSKGQDGRKSQLRKEAGHMDEQIPASPTPGTESKRIVHGL
jgi:hypothetical protein